MVRRVKEVSIEHCNILFLSKLCLNHNFSQNMTVLLGCKVTVGLLSSLLCGPLWVLTLQRHLIHSQTCVSSRGIVTDPSWLAGYSPMVMAPSLRLLKGGNC